MSIIILFAVRDVVASGKCDRMKSGYNRFAANQLFDTFAGQYIYIFPNNL